MITKIELPKQILSLSTGDKVSKRNLFDVIQFSKIKGSDYWGEDEYIIGNTPQQGINWIGQLPYLKCVIIKTRHGAYEADGWENEQRSSFRYSFKARKGVINFSETANKVLIKQPQYSYPILLFVEDGIYWRYEGAFCVSKIEESYVTLKVIGSSVSDVDLSQDELVFQEGNRKYVSHLITERSKSAVAALKSTSKWICDICGNSYSDRYGVEYIGI
jgi:putative restriction endonuclease